MKNTIDVVIAKSFSNKYFYCALLLLSVAPYAQAQQDNFTSPTRSNDAVKNKSRVGMLERAQACLRRVVQLAHKQGMLELIPLVQQAVHATDVKTWSAEKFLKACEQARLVVERSKKMLSRDDYQGIKNELDEVSKKFVVRDVAAVLACVNGAQDPVSELIVDNQLLDAADRSKNNILEQVAAVVETVAAATADHQPSSIVMRDNSGNFSAGTINANLIGIATKAAVAENFAGKLAGEVVGTQFATTVVNAVSNNVPHAIVRRDDAGNFAANNIAANVVTAQTFNGAFHGVFHGTIAGVADCLDCSSDARGVTNVRDCELGLDFINDLRPVSYQVKTENNSARKRYGIVAKEVGSVVKKHQAAQFGGYHYDAKADTHALRYNDFFAPMIRAIQELSAHVQELKGQLKTFKKR